MIETENILTRALEQSLETMAFMTIMPIEEQQAVPQKMILAEISFSGAKSGTVQILSGFEYARTLAENIGALDQADDESAFDAMKELSNVTCGLLTPVMAALPSDEFDVTIPIVDVSENPSQWNEFTADKNSCVFNIEGYLVAVKLIRRD